MATPTRRDEWPFGWGPPARTDHDQLYVINDEVAAFVDAFHAGLRAYAAQLHEQWSTMLRVLDEAYADMVRRGIMPTPPPPPADTRGRALHARGARNTGPPPPPLGRGWRR